MKTSRVAIFHGLLRRHTPVIRIAAAIALPVLALINCSVATVTRSFRLAGPVAGRNLLVAGAGMLGVIAFPQRPLQISAERLVRNLHTLRGLHNYNPDDFTAAVEFIERQHATFPFTSLVDDRFRLDEVNQAFARALSSGAHRVGVRCD